MKKKLCLFILLFTFFAYITYSQRLCSTHENHVRLLQSDAAYRNARKQLDELPLHSTNYKTDETQLAPITIPVVVHVLYNRWDDSLTDEQIYSQIEVLNQDFQLLNKEVNEIPEEFAKVASPTAIRFALAKRKPDGSATNGIVRKFTTKISFSDNDDMKFSEKGGDNAWDTRQYLNIWVCRLNNNLLGYAQLPGGPPETDGVVINPIAFGTCGTAKFPYNKGRTATHEIGHWLNLFHIWGDKPRCEGTDYVDDTPPQSQPTHGIPKKQPSSCGHNSMYMNFMDYTDDAGMAMFTAGQARRMEQLFEPGGFRHSIIFSEGLKEPNETAHEPLPLSDIDCASENFSTRSSAKTLTSNATAYGQINFSGKNDWYEFTNNKVQNNMYISLTHLGADLDVALYDHNGLLLARSRKRGTRPEAIVWNDAEIGKYYIRVYGYRGAFSNQCYVLQTQISKTVFKKEEDDVEEYEENKPEEMEMSASRIYPNPAGSYTHLEVMSDADKDMSIELSDLLGCTVKSYHFFVREGFNSLYMELTDLPTGIYHVWAKNGVSDFKQRLFIRR
jgi:hypothetical protein